MLLCPLSWFLDMVTGFFCKWCVDVVMVTLLDVSIILITVQVAVDLFVYLNAL